MEIVTRAGEIAREAGQLIRTLSKKRDLAIHEKCSTYDFVTEADVASQTLIKERVARLFPQDRVIGEEDGLSDADIIRMLETNPRHSRIWLVDPLDGTMNYIRGIMGYGVSIAVFDGSEVTAAAIYQPDTDALYLAEQNAGAFCNGTALRVASHAKLCECMGGTGVPVSNMDWRRHTNLWTDAIAMECQNLRMLGVAIFAQTRVAAGGLDFYYEIGPHPWDLAAGKLLIEEAGGIMTRLDGGTFDYGMGGLIAASKDIHPEIVRLIRESDPHLNELR